jgi:hypothetical protein
MEITEHELLGISLSEVANKYLPVLDGLNIAQGTALPGS